LQRYGFKMILVLWGVLFLRSSFVYAESAGEYLQDGNDAFKRQELDQAIYDYTKAIDLDPNLGRAYNNRGVAYAQEGSMERAIADFTMAIADNLHDAEAYNNRGQAYVQQGNLPHAIADFTMAIANDAFYIKAYNNRGIAYFNMKEYDKAWSDVHTVEQIGGTVDPDFIKMLKQATGRDQ